MTWLTQDWTGGQLNALVKIIGEKKARELLSGEVRIATETNLLLRDRREIILKGDSSDRGEFLSRYLLEGIIGVEAAKGPKKLLSNLSFWGGASVEMTLLSYDLKGKANGFRIRNELSEFHVFENPNEFCWILNRLVVRQLNGESGSLLTSGVNLFFVKVEGGAIATVRVGRENGKWKIDLADETGYHPSLSGSHRWNSEYVQVRIFDRNEGADPKEH